MVPQELGKAYFSLAYSIDSVSTGKFRKLIVAKPIVDVVTQEELTRKEYDKYEDMVKDYIKDVLGGFAEEKTIDDLFSSGKIEVLDSRYLRGRSFNDSIIFLDDVQLMKPESVLELFIRAGNNSRLIIAGDPVFQTLSDEADPSEIIREVLLNEKDAKVVDLGIKDIVRAGTKRGIRLLLEYKLRSRKLSEAEKKVMDSAKIRAPDADIITVVEFSEEKKKLNITSEHVPDALIVVKGGNAGRLSGERINGIESDTKMKVRVVELKLDFKDIISAVHPLPWVVKHVDSVDFQGNELVVRLKEESGGFIGQKGVNIRLVEYVIKQMFNVGVRVIQPSEENQS